MTVWRAARGTWCRRAAEGGGTVTRGDATKEWVTYFGLRRDPGAGSKRVVASRAL
jgi:hypothetical protein